MNKCKWFYGAVTKEGELAFGSIDNVPVEWSREQVREELDKLLPLSNVVSSWVGLDAEEIIKTYGTDYEVGEKT